MYSDMPTPSDFIKKADSIFMIGFYKLLELKFNKDYNLNPRIIQNISMCSSMLHQCCELYLKSLLCEKSPYLLIRKSIDLDLKNNLNIAINNFYESSSNSISSLIEDFEKLSKDQKKFTDCYTIEAQFLLSEVEKKYPKNIFDNIYNFNFTKFYNDNRVLRNIEIHSHSENDQNYEDVLLSYLAVFNIFKKNINPIKFIYKDILKQIFSFPDNPINKKNESKSEKTFYLRNKYKIPQMLKRDQTSHSRYHLMRICELIFHLLEPHVVIAFFKLHSEFSKNDYSYFCPCCQIYYIAAHEDQYYEIAKNKRISYDVEPNLEINFHYNGFFKSMHPVKRGSSTCVCLICGKKEDIVKKINCRNCKIEKIPVSYALNERCVNCGTIEKI